MGFADIHNFLIDLFSNEYSDYLIALGAAILAIVIVLVSRLWTHPHVRSHPLEHTGQIPLIWDAAYVQSAEQERHVPKHRADDDTRVLVSSELTRVFWPNQNAWSYIPKYMPRIGARRWAMSTPTSGWPTIPGKTMQDLVSA